MNVTHINSIRSVLAGLVIAAGILIVPTVLSAGQRAAPASPDGLYASVLARERALRSPASAGTREEFHALIAQYERIPARFPRSGYSDNALWQAAGLALETFERFGREEDRQTGLRLLRQLRTRYPTSSLLAGLDVRRSALESAIPRAEWIAANSPNRIRRITREAFDAIVRVIIELEREVPFHDERLADPDRLFVDLSGTVPDPELHDLEFDEEPVRRIRLGPRPARTTRVVLDLAGTPACRVSTAATPSRVVIDCDRVASPPPVLTASPAPPAALIPPTVARRPVPRPVPVVPARSPEPPAPAAAHEPEPFPAPDVAEIAPAEVERDDIVRAVISVEADDVAVRTEDVDELPFGLLSGNTAPTIDATPSPPDANSSGSYSLARQLGLGVSRVVIDPGHGGRDPGARANRLVEAEVVLDIALRLEQLLLRDGIEVVLTRRTDVYVPLQERTAIANRVGADLFLSIHANASRNVSANGIETYFLNFASTPEAAAVAARENAASDQNMGRLPDLVKAIALTNKLDESRDFAAMVQASMVQKVQANNRDVRDLGVKQAPFVVLIGAEMPSVLAEVSFLTNRREAQLLQTSAYRQRLAEALQEAIRRYQRSLRSTGAIAAREE